MKKLTSKWWFWVILAFFASFVILMIAGVVLEITNPTNQSYKDLQAELNLCYENNNEMVEAWNEYDKAFNDYCEVDPYIMFNLNPMEVK